HGGTPAAAIVVGEAYEYVHVGAGGVGTIRVDQVNSAFVWAAAAVPGQVGLGVDHAARLGRDRREGAHVGARHHHHGVEPRGSQAVWVKVHLDGIRPDAERVALIIDQHLPAGPNSNAAEIPPGPERRL